MPDAWLESPARLLLSTIVGAVIGLNRDLHHKQAGVRTNALVSLGAALAVLVMMPPGIDPTHRIDAMSRIIQGVLTGIGFLGAGVILRDPSSHHVSGLTTAAAVWLAALLGVRVRRWRLCARGDRARAWHRRHRLRRTAGTAGSGKPDERHREPPDPKNEYRDDDGRMLQRMRCGEPRRPGFAMLRVALSGKS